MQYVFILWTNRGDYVDFKYRCILGIGRDCLDSSGSSGNHGPDERVPVGDLLGDFRDVFVQLFFLPFAGYNYFTNLLRAVGNSVVPLVFLGISAILNIVLDLAFVLFFHWGVRGAAIATVFSQFVSGIGI